MGTIKIVAFDADDTLWHNEPNFVTTRKEYAALLSRYHEIDWIEARLNETEIRNLRHFGYGVKSYILSMIETAIELTEGRVTGEEIGAIVRLGKAMLMHPVELLDDVEETVREMAHSYRLMIVTKGDLFDQESKIARSGLGDFFANIEVLAEKNTAVYAEILDRYELRPEEFVMVGNSTRSDILPVCELGAHAILVPYATEWSHEVVSEEVLERHEFLVANGITEVPGMVARLADGNAG
jgi:putative hydrolase of the HAD superfamily